MKRLCLILLAAAMLAGCGSDEPASRETPQPGTPTPTVETRPAETAAPAAQQPVRERTTRTRAVRGETAPPGSGGGAGSTEIVERDGKRIKVERLPNGEIRSTILD